MMTKTYRFDLLTQMFAAGADQTKAELRATEVRGQLRWWFRALGGLQELRGEVRQQERFLFGGISEGSPKKSALVVRVKQGGLTEQRNDADGLNARQNTPLGYLLFPLRNTSKGYFTQIDQGNPGFSVTLAWRGTQIKDNPINALMTVFGCLGSLGFRSRRCMGAIAFHGERPMPLENALKFFRNPRNITVKELNPRQRIDNAAQCVSILSKWLKGWRSYGRAPNLNPGPGFEYAKRDHDIGLRRDNRPAVRPALGLPIIQRYTAARHMNHWEYMNREAKTRFASPVILRPYRSQNGQIKAVVIFVDIYQWNPNRDRLTVSDHPVDVSLDLYRAMKTDNRLENLNLRGE